MVELMVVLLIDLRGVKLGFLLGLLRGGWRVLWREMKWVADSVLLWVVQWVG